MKALERCLKALCLITTMLSPLACDPVDYRVEISNTSTSPILAQIVAIKLGSLYDVGAGIGCIAANRTELWAIIGDWEARLQEIGSHKVALVVHPYGRRQYPTIATDYEELSEPYLTRAQYSICVFSVEDLIKDNYRIICEPQFYKMGSQSEVYDWYRFNLYCLPLT